MAEIYLGTSGFSYPHWGKGVFYPLGLPQKKWFEFYGQHFKVVELNVSFYRLPQKTTFEDWRRKAGKDFVFAIKGSYFITHIKRLKDCQEPVKRFFKNIQEIKKRKEVILWQFSPKFKIDLERLAEFFKSLPVNWRYAFEFRDGSWKRKEVFNLFQKYRAALVFQDFPQWPVIRKVTADFVYLRLHGRQALYSSCYTDKELVGWAKRIKAWQKRGLDSYVFFNNDALGYAVDNARSLQELCLKKS